MNVFVDTSALYSLLVSSEASHSSITAEYARMLRRSDQLICTSYVILETIALLQHRVGLAAVRDLQDNIVPTLKIVWVDERLHHRALSRLFRENRRQLSLVDCTSMELMKAEELSDVLGLDSHFEEAGFRLRPGG